MSTHSKILDAKEPGVWSIATGENSISFPRADLEVDRGVLVSLYRSIPIPDKEVPLQDILDFRAKRHDELTALRHHLEDVYDRIVSSGDGELTLNKETERLQTAIADHVKASRETGFKLRLVDFGANLNLVRGAQVALGALVLNVPILSALAAGAAASLSAKLGPSLTWRKDNKTPFRYISSFHKELF